MKDRSWNRGVWHHALVTCGAAFLLSSGAAEAVSLGKIEVASPLNEAFFAEVPIKLDGNELASKVFIDIASAADYKIFEVYRDPALNSIRADVASDKRGVRVKLTSRSGIHSPFFNLVLKVRYGRVSHFKKYSVFLDSSKAEQRVIEMQPLPEVQSIAPAAASKVKITPSKSSKLIESAGQVRVSDQDQSLLAAQVELANKPESWARTDKYGPIVRGDSLYVVALRLRHDQRYSINQVMVALLEKNTSSFEHGNMNLIKAGAFLQVPSAEEVEQHNKAEALRVFVKHQQAWKQRPRYSAEAEVQRKRYSNHVSMGNRADGEATGLVPVQTVEDGVKNTAKPVVKQAAMLADAGAVSETDALGKVSPQLEKLLQTQTETNQLLLALQQKNEELQQQLLANKKNVDALHQKVDDGVLEASHARVDKLEILLTRLQAELEKQAQRPALQASNNADWVTWVLLSLLIMMLGVIAMLMRREPTHPAAVQTTGNVIEQDVDSDEAAAQTALQDASASTAKTESLEDRVESEVEQIEVSQAEVSQAEVSQAEVNQTGTNPIENNPTEVNQTASEQGRSRAQGIVTLDSMAAFTDELSDTDTAELEPFDADAKQELDSSVDYLSEADVYIRYGMDEEALQQLDMALRLKADHTEAHIKKAELLHHKQDKHAYAAALTAATAALGVQALEHYQTAIQAFAGDAKAAAQTTSEQAMADTTAPMTVAIDEADLTDIDFGLDDLGIDHTELDIEIADVETARDDLETPKGDLETQNIHEEQPDDMLDWLSDPSFAEDEAMQMSSDIQSQDIQFQEIQTQEIQTQDTISSSTQQLGSLLDEFATEEETTELAREDGVLSFNVDESEIAQFEAITTAQDQAEAVPSERVAPATVPFETEPSKTVQSETAPSEIAFEAVTANTESPAASEVLGDLLSEFSEQDKSSTDVADVAGTHSPSTEGLDFGATQHLDSLLSEFADDDDDLSFADDLSTAIDSDAAVTTAASSTANDVADTDAVYGATQELDHLLSEFSDEVEGLSFIESDDVATDVGNDATAKDLPDIELDHGATQELDSLLGEFIHAEDALGDHIEHGATQVLGHLLDEFRDDLSDDKGHKKD